MISQSKKNFEKFWKKFFWKIFKKKFLFESVPPPVPFHCAISRESGLLNIEETRFYTHNFKFSKRKPTKNRCKNFSDSVFFRKT